MSTIGFDTRSENGHGEWEMRSTPDSVSIPREPSIVNCVFPFPEFLLAQQSEPHPQARSERNELFRIIRLPWFSHEPLDIERKRVGTKGLQRR